MEKEIIEKIKVVRIGVILSLLTLLLGFLLGGLFGAIEGKIKGHLKEEAQAVFDTVYEGDSAKMKIITDKSWAYFKRAHLHASGLGAISLAVILLLMFMETTWILKEVTAIFLGLGSLGYSLFWMFAALKAPGLGSTGAAKEALSFMAIPSAGMCIIGLILVLIIVIKTVCCVRNSSCTS
ncbi:MAG: hypothetical protein K8F52_07980 [Candidatus Scalindua rubra]|uniref:Uncharacterized protein n=1 Tax=Candidatus Scalindua brodae TaxID=237368 RepID=A0A0B0EM80_9BACT|nr:MAG: hypothetical protein SCABRO_02476 [Candidatus Scalindua brodae]MBZ0108595.1 hypothetical protein [Candidatus Scalindua rubra]TWU38163.1 hypothetical protein S225a_02100 [Candidatus Brocadiaceae bacterium S225]